MSKQTHQRYHSFLVRCWLIPDKTTGEPALWRFELREVPAGAQKHRFSDLEELKDFLSAKLGAIATGSDKDSGEEEGWRGGDV
jgi:hypothetical protein